MENSAQAANGRKSIATAAAWRTAGIYAGGAALCVGVMVMALQLWKADLHVPLDYPVGVNTQLQGTDPMLSNDALGACAMAMRIYEEGSFYHSGRLGMPGGMELYDYPQADVLHLTIFRVLCLSSPDYAVALNLFYLLSFVLATVCAMAAMRGLHCSWPTAMAGAVLFAFLPSHLLRGQQHLFLGTYFMVPPAILVLVWLWRGDSLIVARRPTAKGWMAIVILALLGLGGVYYAFFTGLLLVVGALVRLWRERSAKTLIAPILLLAVLGLAFAGAIAPTLVHWAQHGRNAEAVTREPEEAELYGLKIVQLLLPIREHRATLLGDLARRYARRAPLVNENLSASLGLVGSAGLLMLLAWVLGIRRRGDGEDLRDSIAPMTLACLLFGTVGGFGSLLAFTVSPELRATNRISVFIAFFAIVAVMGLLERLRDSARGNRATWPVLVGAVLALGVWDQTSPALAPKYELVKQAYERDGRFVKAIERSVPTGAMIFQLPYMAYPEGARGDYEHFRGFLHSSTLRWSYGAMKHRPTDDWQRRMVYRHAPVQLAAALREEGFAGIYVDRAFMKDPRVEEGLRKIDPAPIVSEDERLVFFRIK